MITIANLRKPCEETMALTNQNNLQYFHSGVDKIGEILRWWWVVMIDDEYGDSCSEPLFTQWDIIKQSFAGPHLKQRDTIQVCLRTVTEESKAQQSLLTGSVADPWHFGVDQDPDLYLRIHASKWIRIRMRIRILLFSSLTLPRCQQKSTGNFFKSFFAYYFLKVHLHHFPR